MIRFNVFFQAKAGKYNEALELTLQLVAESQKHEGCIAYDVFESGTRKDVFMLCETWASWDAHATHIATASFKELMPKIEACGMIKAEHFEF